MTNGFWEKPTGSNHHQTTEMTTSEITSQASVLVSIATPIYRVSSCVTAGSQEIEADNVTYRALVLALNSVSRIYFIGE